VQNSSDFVLFRYFLLWYYLGFKPCYSAVKQTAECGNVITSLSRTSEPINGIYSKLNYENPSLFIPDSKERLVPVTELKVMYIVAACFKACKVLFHTSIEIVGLNPTLCHRCLSIFLCISFSW
jgi:hypothetical protein